VREQNDINDEAVSQLRWLTMADIAAIFGVSRQTIYNHLTNNPDSLLPVTTIPGWRGPRWSMKVFPVRQTPTRGREVVPNSSDNFVLEFQKLFQ
jgi:hypothetical protein